MLKGGGGGATARSTRSPKRVAKDGIEPQPVSGRQEWLENVVNRYV